MLRSAPLSDAPSDSDLGENEPHLIPWSTRVPQTLRDLNGHFLTRLPLSGHRCTCQRGHCGGSLPRVCPRAGTCVSPHATSLDTIRITATVPGACYLDHTGTLSGRYLPTSLQVLFATCNRFYLTWEWLMGSSPTLTSMSMDCHTLPHTSSKLQRQAVASWHTNWRHLLAALNCDDCPTIYRIIIIVVKLKVSTQHYSDSLLITIKNPSEA